MATFAQKREDDVPPQVRAAWERVEAQWDDARTHDELLRLTQLHGCYAWVVARYRSTQRDGRERQIERLRKTAELAMMTSATARPEPKSPYRSSMLALGVLVLMIVAGVAYAMYVRMSHDVGRQVPIDRKVR